MGAARIRRFLQRGRLALAYVSPTFSALVRWLFESNETTNFTYDLEDRNKRHLAALLAEVLGIPFDAALGYIREIDGDRELAEHVRTATRRSDRADIADGETRVGRRAGWYVVARVLKPKVVVETGVDKGLGACVLAAALRRNAAEGFPGRYYGTDIDRRAGYLLSGDYAKVGAVLYGDSLASLRALEGPIDLFINDSDHSADYEAREYREVEGKLSPEAVILGDNAHGTDALLEFSVAAGRRFVFFQERPLRHWYPGAGIGISFLRKGDR